MTEKDLIHDIVNSLTIAHGKLMRAQLKPDKYSKNEIVDMIGASVKYLEKTFSLIRVRRAEIEAGVENIEKKAG